MKRGNLDKWTDIKGCENLLFFSQLVNELLFDYSIPSNRISTLNSHYLCVDAITAINGIEYKGVHEGTLKPIMEELHCELKNDPVFQENYKPLDYFLKYQNDKYELRANVSEFGCDDSKKTVYALNQVFFSNNKYYFQLRDQIVKIIKENNCNEQENLFRLTKSMLTELKNSGYSLRYIYEIMNDLFWEPSAVVASPCRIDGFFARFDFTKKKYKVVFKVKSENVNKMIDYSILNNLYFKCIDDLPDELKNRIDKSFSNHKKGEKFLIVDEDGLDPFAAAHQAVNAIENLVTSIYRFYDHTYSSRIRSAKCVVLDDDNIYKVVRDVQAIEHTKLPSNQQMSENMRVAGEAIKQIIDDKSHRNYKPLIGAVRYHSHALDSLSEENQLLDCWAIFESVLDISNKHTTDRIQQVCMYLVPLLKQKYIYSLFKQLVDDIKTYNEKLYTDIVGSEENEFEIVRAICEFTLLDAKEKERKAMLAKCDDFPLLKERINYYGKMLSSPKRVHSFVEKHAKRVRWQIMRIYRNRNMIIHNGENMSYLSLLIENLHSYVDDFISYVIHGVAEGKDINAMCQELFVKECEWNSKFQKVKDPITLKQIKYMLSM